MYEEACLEDGKKTHVNTSQNMNVPLQFEIQKF